jgi:hypothetical protein
VIRLRCGEAGGACASAGQGPRRGPADFSGAAVVETVDRGVQRAGDDHDVCAGDRARGSGPNVD